MNRRGCGSIVVEVVDELDVARVDVFIRFAVACRAARRAARRFVRPLANAQALTAASMTFFSFCACLRPTAVGAHPGAETSRCLQHVAPEGSVFNLAHGATPVLFMVLNRCTSVWNLNRIAVLRICSLKNATMIRSTSLRGIWGNELFDSYEELLVERAYAVDLLFQLTQVLLEARTVPCGSKDRRRLGRFVTTASERRKIIGEGLLVPCARGGGQPGQAS